MPTITILESSPRAANWLHIFGRLTDIPIRSPFPIRVHVPDHQNALAYLLDVSLITPEERLRLVNHLAKYFSLTHAEVERDLDSDGVPILADDVIVSIPQGIALSMINDPFDLDEEIDWQDDHCGYDGEKETDILTDKKTPKTDAIVYDFAHVRRVAYLSSDADCVEFRTFAMLGGQVIDKLREDVVSESDLKVALSLFKGVTEQAAALDEARAEIAALQQRITDLELSAENGTAIMYENKVLKEQLRAMQTAPDNGAPPASDGKCPECGFAHAPGGNTCCSR